MVMSAGQKVTALRRGFLTLNPRPWVWYTSAQRFFSLSAQLWLPSTLQGTNAEKIFDSSRRLTFAAGGAVVPVPWKAALAVAAPSAWEAGTAVGERMAGGAGGGGPTFTPPTALTAGETGVALLDSRKEELC